MHETVVFEAVVETDLFWWRAMNCSNSKSRRLSAAATKREAYASDSPATKSAG